MPSEVKSHCLSPLNSQEIGWLLFKWLSQKTYSESRFEEIYFWLENIDPSRSLKKTGETDLSPRLTLIWLSSRCLPAFRQGWSCYSFPAAAAANVFCPCKEPVCSWVQLAFLLVREGTYPGKANIASCTADLFCWPVCNIWLQGKISGYFTFG